MAVVAARRARDWLHLAPSLPAPALASRAEAGVTRVQVEQGRQRRLWALPGRRREQRRLKRLPETAWLLQAGCGNPTLYGGDMSII